MSASGNVYALLIGINDYESEAVRRLQFAVADVLAFHEILGQRLQLRQENCILLTHPSAGTGSIPVRKEMLRALAQFSKAPMGPDDTFLLYFAGHGFSAADKSYLLTVDSDPALPELLAETAVSLETVTRFTRQVKAGQHLLILDACRNNPTTLSRSTDATCLDTAMARDIATLARAPSFGESPCLPARATLSACWEGQVSYEYPARSHGWFSYNFLESLRNHPSEVLDVSEIVEQVRQRMLDRAWRELPEAGRQTPHIVIEGRPVRLRLSGSQDATADPTPSGAAPPAPAQRPQIVAPPPPVVVPEAIKEDRRLPCPACGKVLRLKPSAAAKELPCPGCNTILKVSADLQQVTVKVAGPSVGTVEIGRKWPSASAQTPVHQTAQTPFVVPVPGPTTAKELTVDLGNGIKLEMVLICAGEFLMGSPESDTDAGDSEKPQHVVRIRKPFYLGKYLVTQEQWEAVTGSNPSDLKGPKNPVENVSWDDCQGFCAKLGASFRGTFRLPSEAQWEYACRAGSAGKYCFGANKTQLAEYAWYTGNAESKTHPVGEKKPNAWGLYDMHGNVWEWCADWYDSGYYAGSLADDPTGPTTGPGRVLRGGGWFNGVRHCRSANRRSDAPGYRSNGLGLRVSRVPLSPPQGAPAGVAPSESASRVPAQGPRIVAIAQVPVLPANAAEGPQPPWTKEVRPAAIQDSWTNDLGISFRLISPGRFAMGASRNDSAASADEQPRMTLTIPRPFWAATFPVTNAVVRRFLENAPLDDDPRFAKLRKDRSFASQVRRGKVDDNLPAVEISHDDAEILCAWLQNMDGRHYRMPVEAEWEYMARAGTAGPYWWDDGSGAGERAVFAATGPAPANPRRANAWGLIDVLGNVAEWTASAYAPLDSGAALKSADDLGGDARVVRGGSWRAKGLDELRVSRRKSMFRRQRADDLGVRIVCDIECATGADE